jgi:tetratricopeptide (TPR) repeat protein
MGFWRRLFGGGASDPSAEEAPVGGGGDTEALRRADGLVRQGQHAEATAILTQMLERMPAGWKSRAESPTRVAAACWDENDFREVAHLHSVAGDRRLLAWSGVSYSKACHLLGFMAIEEGDLRGAERHIRRGLELEPDHPHLLCELGLILRQTGRIGEAFTTYMAAAELWPGSHASATAGRGMGACSIDAGELDKARLLFEMLLELDPGDELSRAQLDVVAELERTGGTASARVVRTRPGPGS